MSRMRAMSREFSSFSRQIATRFPRNGAGSLPQEADDQRGPGGGLAGRIAMLEELAEERRGLVALELAGVQLRDPAVAANECGIGQHGHLGPAAGKRIDRLLLADEDG